MSKSFLCFRSSDGSLSYFFGSSWTSNLTSPKTFNLSVIENPRILEFKSLLCCRVDEIGLFWLIQLIFGFFIRRMIKSNLIVWSLFEFSTFLTFQYSYLISRSLTNSLTWFYLSKPFRGRFFLSFRRINSSPSKFILISSFSRSLRLLSFLA
jgi:hypothetical protein